MSVWLSCMSPEEGGGGGGGRRGGSGMTVVSMQCK